MISVRESQFRAFSARRLYAFSPRALPWAITFRALGAGDSSFDTDSELLGYYQFVRWRGRTERQTSVADISASAFDSTREPEKLALQISNPRVERRAPC